MARKTFTLIGEFHGAHFNGTYTTQEVVDRINSDSAEFTAELVDDGTIRAIPRANQTKSTLVIGTKPSDDTPARYEYAMYVPRLQWANRLESTLDKCIKKAQREVGYGKRRVVLLDGTVVKEWE
jgi:hypothetical protein